MKIEKSKSVLFSLLLGNADSSTATTCGFGVLTSDTNTPVMSQTSVGADLLETLQILSELVVQGVGSDL